MSGFGVVLYGEGEEGRAGWGAELEDCFIGMAVESTAAAGEDGWVFDPDFEASV